VDAATLTAALAVAALAAAIGILLLARRARGDTGRPRARRYPGESGAVALGRAGTVLLEPPPDADEERAELLSLVTGPIFERLDDDGLWLPGGTRVETLYVPVEQVGGDFLGTMEVDGQAVAFIGDVAGHGLDAAIVALRVKEVVGDVLREGGNLDDAVTHANELLREDVPGFATLFACRLGDDGRLTFVNAGHVPPLVLDGVPPEELEPTGPLLGAFPHDYEQATVEVEPADRVLAFTDGVTDAFGARGGLSDEEIRGAAARPGAFVDLAAAVRAKRPGEPMRDDLAAFELTVGGEEEAEAADA
jgi:hypothetical protein